MSKESGTFENLGHLATPFSLLPKSCPKTRILESVGRGRSGEIEFALIELAARREEIKGLKLKMQIKMMNERLGDGIIGETYIAYKNVTYHVYINDWRGLGSMSHLQVHSQLKAHSWYTSIQIGDRLISLQGEMLMTPNGRQSKKPIKRF